MSISRETLHPQGDLNTDIYPTTDADQIVNDLSISNNVTVIANDRLVREITISFANSSKSAKTQLPYYNAIPAYAGAFTPAVKTGIRAFLPIGYPTLEYQTYIVLYPTRIYANNVEYVSLDGSVHVIINTQDWSIQDVSSNIIP